MLTIWNEFARLVSDAAPAFALGLMLSSGVQWLVERSHWAARALSWLAQLSRRRSGWCGFARVLDDNRAAGDSPETPRSG